MYVLQCCLIEVKVYVLPQNAQGVKRALKNPFFQSNGEIVWCLTLSTYISEQFDTLHTNFPCCPTIKDYMQVIILIFGFIHLQNME